MTFSATLGSFTRSQSEVAMLNNYKASLRQKELANLSQRLCNQETNNIDFYTITPKDQLPKYLQKLKFQTLHRQGSLKSVKVFNKENRRPEELEARKKIKQEGNIMLLSEIYQHLGENREIGPQRPPRKTESDLSDLEGWERRQKQERLKIAQLKGIDTRSEEISSVITKGLELIESTQYTEPNILTRINLIENKSKLLKRELDDSKENLQAKINSKLDELRAARDVHHSLYEERSKITTHFDMKDEQIISAILTPKTNQTTFTKIIPDSRSCRRTQFDSVNQRIEKVKAEILVLEEALMKTEEELGHVKSAEENYFRVTLRLGVDCRESGLVWALKHLSKTNADLKTLEYPKYLDKRSRSFLISRTQLQLQLDGLLEEKSRFVNEIGKMHQKRDSFSRDRILEAGSGEIPKKYRRSLKKMSVLNEEYARNQSILEHQRDDRKTLELSCGMDKLNGIEIYKQVSERIKRIDFSKFRKERSMLKKSRLAEYQRLLSSIQQVHIRIEDQQIHHENYLLTHTQCDRKTFFQLSSACFGYKKAYSLIIKHFSWKSDNEHL